MTTGQDIVDVARTHAGAKYSSHPWDQPGTFDCSLLVQTVCNQLGVSPQMPRTSDEQLAHCQNNSTMTTIDIAVRTPGALLIRQAHTHPDGTSHIAHIAFTIGNGFATFEATGSAWPVGELKENRAYRHWSHAAFIPGVSYGGGGGGGGGGGLPGDPHPRLGRPRLSVNTNGPAFDGQIRVCQTLLIQLGYAQQAGFSAPTGFFGPKTRAASMAFQQYVRTNHAAGFDVDGIVGPYTFGWLFYLAGRGNEE